MNYLQNRHTTAVTYRHRPVFQWMFTCSCNSRWNSSANDNINYTKWDYCTGGAS
ncbi:hypothetical protein BCR42DRAFT_428270 [Absidia repens]|uniref:Uncharacterized protein n=1 Tax=Absidia repens TaxID=90262 RepID=A0A1X2HYP0_9FUNG|nr:hypothetical protein BCR42DRAFT_428270 [Absidia repens]